jgi:hypothetical protein
MIALTAASTEAAKARLCTIRDTADPSLYTVSIQCSLSFAPPKAHLAIKRKIKAPEQRVFCVGWLEKSV